MFAKKIKKTGEDTLHDLASEIKRRGVQITKDAIDSFLHSGTFTQRCPEEGGLWITNVDGSWMQQNGKIISAYYHPTHRHAATTIGKSGTNTSFG